MTSENHQEVTEYQYLPLPPRSPAEPSWVPIAVAVPYAAARYAEQSETNFTSFKLHPNTNTHFIFSSL